MPAKSPERVGSILRNLLQNLGLDKRIEEYDAYFSWDRIVGEKIAGVTRVKSVRDGVLVVEVKGSVWMSEINMVKHQLIEKLNEGKNSGAIKDIVLVQWRGRNGQ
jgi:predicted nucleic acid-binding Zn ribbon protein